MMKLYSYFRSSAAYRVRIALNIKGLDYDIVPVHLVKDGGEHHKAEYKELNPQGALPAFIHDDVILAQSMAIIEYLDDIQKDPPLVFGTAAEKAYTRRMAQIIVCDMHPLNNLRVMKYMTGPLGISERQRMDWTGHWNAAGLSAYEAVLQQKGIMGMFTLGDTPSLADACLIPQLYNARRFFLTLDGYPLCRKIEENCMALEAFQKAAPESQPDTPEDLETIHGPDFMAA